MPVVEVADIDRPVLVAIACLERHLLGLAGLSLRAAEAVQLAEPGNAAAPGLASPYSLVPKYCPVSGDATVAYRRGSSFSSIARRMPGNDGAP
jgi:hypothetical protein